MRPDSFSARLTGLAAVVLALALVSGPAAAQQEDASTDRDTAAASDTAGETVDYRREVFTYPTGGRVDPFRPPQVEGSGPRFEDLELAGIIYAPSVGSVAIVTDRSTGKRYRVRENERVGSARVTAIRAQQVVFSVGGATGSRREVLRTDQEEEENEG